MTNQEDKIQASITILKHEVDFLKINMLKDLCLGYLGKLKH